MAKFKLTNNAVKDLSDIWNYTFDAWSESQADNYYRLILNACAAIANKPQQGKEYEEIYPDLKGKKACKPSNHVPLGCITNFWYIYCADFELWEKTHRYHWEIISKILSIMRSNQGDMAL